MFRYLAAEAGNGNVKKKEKKALSSELSLLYLKAQAYMMGMPRSEFYFLPIGELSDLISAKSIILGLADESVPLKEEDYLKLE